MALASIQRAATASLMLMGCSACSSTVEYIRSEYTPEKRVDGRVLTSLSLSPEDEDTPKIDVYKIRKGYALKQNLDWNRESGRKGDIVMSKSKEYDWFAGLQWRFEL